MSKHTLSHETKVNMRGGEKEVVISHFLKDADLPNHLRLMGVITLIPGASIGEHTHNNESEVFYIIEGKGNYLSEGQWIAVEKGDVLLCASGGTHSIVNTGDTDLVFTGTIVLD